MMKNNIVPAALAGVIFLIGCTLTYFTHDRWQTIRAQAIQLEFDKFASEFVQRLQIRLDNNLYIVRVLKAFYENSNAFDYNTFAGFSDNLIALYPGVQALEWVPRVVAKERGTYEEKIRAEGFPSFTFTELDDNGEIVPASPRDEYFPVYYISPLQGNFKAMGYDLASNEARSNVMEFSAKTGRIQISSTLKLIQQQEGLGFIMVLPVFEDKVELITNVQRQQALKGFILAEYHIDSIIDSNAVIENQPFDVYLFDASTFNAFEPIYNSLSLTEYNYFNLPKNVENIAIFEASVHLPGRVWNIVAVPKPDSLLKIDNRFTLFILVCGTLISGLIAILVLIIAMKIKQASNMSTKSQRLFLKNTVLHKNNKALENFNRALFDTLEAPIRQLNGFTQLLLKNKNHLDEKQLRYIDIIANAAHTVDGLLNDLLRYAQTNYQKIKLRQVNIDNLFNQSIEEYSSLSNELKIDWNFTSLPNIKADEQLMKIVLNALIENSINFAKTHPIKAFDIGYINPQQSNQASHDTDRVIIYIKSKGAQLNLTNMDHYFDLPQWAIKDSQLNKSGIGLTIAKRIIQCHGEKISINTDITKGITFCFSAKLWRP